MNNNLEKELNKLKKDYIKKIGNNIAELEILINNFQQEDIDKIYMIIHKISGTSGMYGLKEMSEKSTELEMHLKELKDKNNFVPKVNLQKRLLEYLTDIKTIVDGGEYA